MNKLPKSIHMIGICGVATSSLAIALHERGVKVTGSDKGFFPPVSTELEGHGVPFYAGWHPEKMTAGGLPEAVIVGTASGSRNPETALAKECGIPIYSFAEAIGRFFSKKNCVVCAGTWGKTSSAALLSFMLDRVGFDPTYMFGGISLSHKSSARLSGGDWSVFEGDEYKSSPSDPTAKFFYYKPTHLLLGAVSWDHADLYPTEKDYFDVFRKLLSSLQDKGFAVACADNTGVRDIMSSRSGRTIWYGKYHPPDSGQDAGFQADSKRQVSDFQTIRPDYEYDSMKQSRHGLDFTIIHRDKTGGTGQRWDVHSPMLGTYQAENITGCFAVAHSMGIAPEEIVGAIAQFRGLKRRLEKRLDGYAENGGIPDRDVTVIDDIAHSPEKAASVLKTLREIYSGKVIAIFEPNTGGRQREAIRKYDNAFKDADIVVIPRLTKLKVAENDLDGSAPIEGDELARIIGAMHPKTHYIEDDKETVTFLGSRADKGDVIVFLGSHGFRGMIEEIVETLKRGG